MKTGLLVGVAVLAFSSMAASCVMDDDALLREPDRYNPHPKQDRMVQLTVKKSGVTFCIDKGEWTLMKGDVCEREETPEDTYRRQMERARAGAEASKRYQKLTDEEHHQFREKKRRELLGGPRFIPHWEIVSLH